LGALGVRDGDQGHHLELAHQGWKIRQIKAAMHRRYCLAPVSREYGKMEEVGMEMNVSNASASRATQFSKTKW
jgi:hypothetical protein